MQQVHYGIGGAMTDPKGDRSKAPSDQSDPDLFVRVVERRPDGVVIRGAKMHQTGCLNSHWIVVMPTMRLREADRDRSEEHTSELQSRQYLVCRLLLEKKKT